VEGLVRDNMPIRILVTGNLGYIGSVMTPMLAEAGYEVWGLDTGYFQDCVLPGQTISRRHLSKQIVKDVRAVNEHDLTKVDAIIHLAALSNDPLGELNPNLTEEINYLASVRLASMAKTAGISRFLFSSSCSLYGQGSGTGLTEESPFNPLTAYARSKVLTETSLSKLADKDFSPVYLRNATVYGLSPRIRLDLVVNNLTGWGFTTGQVRLLSDGTAWRPNVHIEDVCGAFLAALRAPRDIIHNQAFNVGVERDNFRIRDIADTVAKVVPDCKVSFAEGANPDSRSYNVSFKKINRLLPEFTPIWSLEKAVEALYRAFQRSSLSYADFEGRSYTRLKQLKYLMSSGLIDPNLYWLSSSPRGGLT